MEFEAFGKTFTLGKKAPEEAPPTTDEELAEEVENFEFVADIATINAIPLEVTRRYRVRGVAQKYGLILGIVVVSFGAIWAGSTAFLAHQEGRVTALNEERDLLQQEADALSPFQQYKQALDNKRSVLSDSTQTDINYGQMYEILTTTAEQQGVSLKTIDISQFAEEGETGGCVSPDPLNQTSGVIGCVSLTASTPNEVQLINFLRGLENSPSLAGGFILPSIASFSSEGGASGQEEAAVAETSVNMSIFFTHRFYSNKYEDLLIPIEELITGPVSEEEEAEAPEMSFEDQMVGVAFKVSESLQIEGSIDNLEMLTNIASAVCETGEAGEQQTTAEILAGSTETLTAEEILVAVGERC